MNRELVKLLEFTKASPSSNLIMVTVESTEGSTYKKKNALKIIAPTGESEGIISGGCFEAQINKYALNMKDDSSYYSIDTTDEMDKLFGTSIGCQGVTNLFFEKLSKNEIISKLEAKIINFPKINIYGAGPDAEPLYELLKWMKLDFKFYSTREDIVIEKQNDGWPIGKIDLNNLDSSKNQFIILMTHNYPIDLEILNHITKENIHPEYLGILGPKKRFEQLQLDLVKIYNRELSQNVLEKISAPIGLDGMGKGESAIALSILSEIQQILTQLNQGYSSSKPKIEHNELSR